MIFERKLFCGLSIDVSYKEALKLVDPKLLSFFVNKEGQYLVEHSYNNSNYLGRIIPSPLSMGELELAQLHIFSLLKRIVPSYSYETQPLWLLPVIESPN